jgi:hypothetical protein
MKCKVQKIQVQKFRENMKCKVQKIQVQKFREIYLRNLIIETYIFRFRPISGMPINYSKIFYN